MRTLTDARMIHAGGWHFNIELTWKCDLTPISEETILIQIRYHAVTKEINYHSFKYKGGLIGVSHHDMNDFFNHYTEQSIIECIERHNL